MMRDPQPKKSLGQHWLTDRASLEAMCRTADVRTSDTVLEIGPGLGTLTAMLVQRAAAVIAVELDTELAAELPRRVDAVNLVVVQQDILRFDTSSLPLGYKVVANIPYYLTSNLVRVLSESSNPPARAVLLVQKEVAERLAARPGSMSLLSVTAQYYWDVHVGSIVPAALFTPPPRVDSQIVRLDWRQQLQFPDVDTRSFFRIVKAGFSQKRKTLLNSLSAGLQRDKASVEETLQKSGLEPATRAQALSLEQWHRLYRNT